MAILYTKEIVATYCRTYTVVDHRDTAGDGNIMDPRNHNMKKYAAGAHNIMLQETVELVRQQGLKATGFTVDMSNK